MNDTQTEVIDSIVNDDDDGDIESKCYLLFPVLMIAARNVN